MLPIQQEILHLKEKEGFTILAHNYVDGTIQDIADFVGDSLELSRKAAECHAQRILFCGVRFMAETAKLLSPHSQVILANAQSGCPMADMCHPDALRAWKKDHPQHMILAYVNTTAETKSLVDLCVTSGNAERILRQLDTQRPILFLPDQNLGTNLNNKLNIHMDLWNGFCPTHNRFSLNDFNNAKAAAPADAVSLVHLECRPEIVAQADAALSTAGMIAFVKNSTAKHFIIGTEEGMLHKLRTTFPERDFIGICPSLRCPNMKKITLDDVLTSLNGGGCEIQLSSEILQTALSPIEKMLAMS